MTYADQLSRARLIAENGEAWNMTPEEQDALKAVLKRLDYLEIVTANELKDAKSRLDKLERNQGREWGDMRDGGG